MVTHTFPQSNKTAGLKLFLHNQSDRKIGQYILPLDWHESPVLAAIIDAWICTLLAGYHVPIFISTHVICVFALIPSSGLWNSPNFLFKQSYQLYTVNRQLRHSISQWKLHKNTARSKHLGGTLKASSLRHERHKTLRQHRVEATVIECQYILMELELELSWNENKNNWQRARSKTRVNFWSRTNHNWNSWLFWARTKVKQNISQLNWARTLTGIIKDVISIHHWVSD